MHQPEIIRFASLAATAASPSDVCVIKQTFGRLSGQIVGAAIRLTQINAPQ